MQSLENNEVSKNSVPAVDSKQSSNEVPPEVNPERFPHNFPRLLNIFIGQNGIAYVEITDAGNRYVLAVGSRALNLILMKMAHEHGERLRKNDLVELNEHLRAHAEMAGLVREVWYRVASSNGSIEIDVGDDQHTRIRVKDGQVEVVPVGSEVLFYRTKSTLPMSIPAEVGNLELLTKYLNMHPASMVLFIAWLSYTLAHPKINTSKYVILVLQGNQGSGKSFLCRLIAALIDPNSVGLQLMPTNPKDLAIASQNAHVLCYDNIRGFKQSMADNLCVASTGGTVTSRQLYTDAEQQVLHLHAAVVLNGIHSFIDQPDLAQRCLPIDLLVLPEENRKSESDLVSELMADLPVIFRGLLDLIAKIFVELPSVEVTNPERMYDFAKWLAAMEKVDGVPAGIYQGEYSFSLKQGQLDALLDDTLASAIVTFAEQQSYWEGTPAELLAALNRAATQSIQRSREWPQNPIALSKRLRPFQAALISQGIKLEFGRSKQRTITISFQG